jgi:hypothetical protein
MDPDPRDDVAREILLAEYKALRDEIIKKMDHRATFRISALTLTVAAIAAGVQFRNNMLLLLVPHRGCAVQQRGGVLQHPDRARGGLHP